MTDCLKKQPICNILHQSFAGVKGIPLKSEVSDEYFVIFAVALSYLTLMSLRKRIMLTGGSVMPLLWSNNYDKTFQYL